MTNNAMQDLYNSAKDWLKETDLPAQVEAYENIIMDIEIIADKYSIQLEGREEN